MAGPLNSRLRYPQTGLYFVRSVADERLLHGRYDMLCFEGIARMLNIFLGRTKAPSYRVVAPPDGEAQVITVQKEVGMDLPTGVDERLMLFDRLHVLGHMFPVPFYGISNSIKNGTTHSSLSRISYIRILLDSVRWYLLARTT